jgi:hypothetical protein
MKTYHTEKPANSNFPATGIHAAERKLTEIANWQKGMLCFIGPWFGFAFLPAPASLHWIQQIGFWLFHAGLVFHCYEQAKLLRKNVIVWTLLAAIPIVNAFVVGRLFSRATKILKDNGIPVGIWGAKYPYWCLNRQ